MMVRKDTIDSIVIYTNPEDSSYYVDPGHDYKVSYLANVRVINVTISVSEMRTTPVNTRQTFGIYGDLSTSYYTKA